MFRRLPVVAILILAVCGWALAADHSSNVTIMTQNMDDGTDLTYIVGAFTNQIPGLSLGDAVDLTYKELQATKFEQRIGQMAKQIAARKPDLLALQEASFWRTGATADNPTVPLFDLIQMLMQGLNAAGVPYDLVAVANGSDLALPGTKVPVLRLTDRDALLIRSDLRPPGLHLSDVHVHTYDAVLPFGPFQVTSEWIAAMVHTGNQQFRLITTHLQSSIPGVPQAAAIQVAQAQELIHELRNSTLPVVLCGDFNSDATHSGQIDDTPTVDVIQAAGYREVWGLLHGADPGFTWPLYLEDNLAAIFGGPFFGPSRPFERIDLFFQQNMQPISIDLVKTVMPSLAGPPFGSDHAGVIAVFQP